jgi:hypothetical protein
MASSIQSVSYFNVTLSKVVFRKKIRLASPYFDYAAFGESDDGIAEPMGFHMVELYYCPPAMEAVELAAK